jgi:hypothetical protein
LHGVFTDTLPSDPPRALSNDVVSEVVKRYKVDREAFNDIDSDPEFDTHPELVIKRLITKRLPAD